MIDLINNRVEGKIGVGFFIAAFSALREDEIGRRVVSTPRLCPTRRPSCCAAGGQIVVFDRHKTRHRDDLDRRPSTRSAPAVTFAEALDRLSSDPLGNLPEAETRALRDWVLGEKTVALPT